MIVSSDMAKFTWSDLPLSAEKRNAAVMPTSVQYCQFESTTIVKYITAQFITCKPCAR